MAYPVISADSHVVEPLALWSDRLPRGLRDRAPRLEEHNGHNYITIDVNGQSVYLVSADDHSDDAAVGPDRAYDPEERVREIEADGVWGEVLYPTVGLFAWSMPDPEVALASARVYNDWMADTFKGYTDRFAAGAIIPAVVDAKASVAEVERAAALGLRPLMLPIIPPADKPYYDPLWNPVWEAAQAQGLPLSFHAASGIDASLMQNYDPADMGLQAIQRRGLLTMVQMVAAPAHVLLSQLLTGNVFERFPDLRIAIVETQIGWLAWVLDELDRMAEGPGVRETLGLKELPSTYVRRQVGITFMDDRVGLYNRTLTGSEPLMWGSDYPHPEGTWPHSAETLERLFDGVDSEERRAITSGNVARLFGFDVPTMSSTEATGGTP